MLNALIAITLHPCALSFVIALLNWVRWGSGDGAARSLETYDDDRHKPRYQIAPLWEERDDERQAVKYGSWRIMRIFLHDSPVWHVHFTNCREWWWGLGIVLYSFVSASHTKYTIHHTTPQSNTRIAKEVSNHPSGGAMTHQSIHPSSVSHQPAPHFPAQLLLKANPKSNPSDRKQLVTDFCTQPYPSPPKICRGGANQAHPQNKTLPK